LLISSVAFSQKIFREGYIIKKNGEFIEGLVGYVPGNSIPKICSFKRFDIAVEISYAPADIRAFGYKGEMKFESLKLHGNPVFLKVLVGGDITLLSRESKFYVKDTGDRLVEVSGGTIIWQQQNFPGPQEFLNYLASEAGIQLKEKTGLKDNIIPVVSAYNLKNGKDFIVYRNDISANSSSKMHVQYDGARTRIGILSGINIYSLKLSLDKGGYIPSPEQERSVFYGLSVERMLTRRTVKLMFRTGVLYLAQNFYTYKEESEYGRFTKNDAFFDFKAVKVPVLIQYNFPGMKLIPYLNGGLGGMFLLKKNYFHIVEQERTDGSIDTYEDSNMKFASSEVSALIGAGMKIKMMNDVFLRLEGGFEYGTGIFQHSQFDNLNQHSIQPSLMIGLTF
jgi:hypothetical protein